MRFNKQPEGGKLSTDCLNYIINVGVCFLQKLKHKNLQKVSSAQDPGDTETFCFQNYYQ